ncbi:recombinase family protein [Patescibacteria group bacterium]|nr:MAG: recombinase family protein [Patescibacteria group bacterium]
MIVALYARVSTTKQADMNLSIPDQLKQMRAWCAENGHFIAREFVEPGASATDDKRPVFAEMIDEACQKKPPYEAIIVHSFSRFFRNALESSFYELKLKKAGVAVVSTTQPSGDDDSGFLSRGFYKILDEFFSRENSKHTSRGMKENARQGYFNGSHPLFGYRKKPVDGGAKNRQKHVLEPDPVEAAIIRKIFESYTSGRFGGIKEIASFFNSKNMLRRGAKWSGQTILHTLSNKAYQGEYFFNKRHGKTGKLRPESEWIKVALEPIIDAEMFQKAEKLRQKRAPKVSVPRIVNSPTLLTGLLRCGSCGSPMTTSTGKYGKYRYYKCTRKIHENSKACDSSAVQMEKLDNLILDALSERVFTPERVKDILTEQKKNSQKSAGKVSGALQHLKNELKKLDEAKNRLYEAVEAGLPFDNSLRERVRFHDNRRQEMLSEMAILRQKSDMPLSKITTSEITAFCAAIRKCLLDIKSFAKSYLQLLVDEIRIEGNTAIMCGSNAALEGLVAKKKLGTSLDMCEVPSFKRRGEPCWD